MRYDIRLAGKTYRLELQRSESHWECRLDGREVSIQAVPISPDTLSLLMDGKSFEVKQEPRGEGQSIFVRGKRYEVSVQDPRSWRGRKRTEQGQAGPQRLIASMPGKLVRVLAREGETLLAGQGVAVVEAMKMQNEIRSPRAGVLKRMLAREGMNVTAGEVLAIVE